MGNIYPKSKFASFPSSGDARGLIDIDELEPPDVMKAAFLKEIAVQVLDD
jgi:hypothetical protein